MKTLKLATMTYVATFDKHLGQTTPTAYAARETAADNLVAAAFETLEGAHSVNDAPIAADDLDFTLGAAKEMADFMTMAGQDAFVRGDAPEEVYADMMAEAREYLYSGPEAAPKSEGSIGSQS